MRLVPYLLFVFFVLPASARQWDPPGVLDAFPAVDGEVLWPGFHPETMPLAVYDGARVWLVRHPAPPEGFTPVPGHPEVWVHEGPHPAVRANTSAVLGGVHTATLLLNGPDSDPARTRRIAVHELFHVYQRTTHPGWQGNEADLFTYPFADTAGYRLRLMETGALRRALLADGPAKACWARSALQYRDARFARLDSAYVAYERGTEMNEGLALYVEFRADPGADPPAFPPAGFAPEKIRDRAYVAGYAQARLLDAFAPEWPRTLEADPGLTLDRLLHRVMDAEEGEFCRLDKGETHRLTDTAREAIEDLHRREAALLHDFRRQPGSRVRLILPSDAPLWPAAFDPLNVSRVPGGLLHTRMLRLRNDLGEIDLLDGSAYTVPAGPHPLFNGVREVEVAGLEGRPAVTWGGGETLVTLDSVLHIRMRNANVEERGDTLVVTVHR